MRKKTLHFKVRTYNENNKLLNEEVYDELELAAIRASMLDRYYTVELVEVVERIIGRKEYNEK